MELDIKPLMPGMDFAVEIKNIDLSQSLDNVIFEEIRQAVFSYAVVVIRGQSINDEQQISFSERFGELEKSLVKIDGEIKFPQIYITTNVGKDDKILPRDGCSCFRRTFRSLSKENKGMAVKIRMRRPPSTEPI